jgi:glycosyltransferase involved in cell wall biosynthesis
MRILYNHRIVSKDGQYVHLEELVMAFRRAGHEVIVVGPSILENKEFGSEGGIVNSLRKVLPSVFCELLEFAYSLFAYIRLRRAASRAKPDFIYERYNLFSPAGTWVSKNLCIPLVLEVNAPLYEERARYTGIGLKRLALWSQNYVWRNADAVLPVTAALAKIVRDAGVQEDSITVLHNGVVLEKFAGLRRTADVKKTAAGEYGVTFGFVGFIRDWHRLDSVIQAMVEQELAQMTLIVVGEGPARDQLEALAQELGLTDRVFFFGLVQRLDLLEIMADFDVALQPHVVSYASPLKLFEYMAMGLPIVAPNTANINEVLTHEENAFLFEPGDCEGLRKALVRLATDKHLREALGQSAIKRLQSGGFTWDDNAQRIDQIATALRN